MADIEKLKPGEILADASVADFISRLGLGIAEAQRALDENSIAQLGEFVQPREGLGGRTLLDLGLMPAFYHYQHADLSCALQLSMRVAKDEGFGFSINGNFGDNSSNNGSSDNTSAESESGSSSSRNTRSAALSIKTSTTGALTVNGQNLTLAGTNPQDRIRQLSQALRGNAATGVSRVAVTPPTQAVNPTVEPPHEQVVASPNAVAFMAGGAQQGAIEVEALPAAPEEFQLKAGVVVTSAVMPTLDAYAADIATKIHALGYNAFVTQAGQVLSGIKFDLDSSFIRDQPDAARLRRVARFLKASGLSVRVRGYTDRSGPSSYNVGLGNRRVAATIAYLQAQGVSAAQLQAVTSTGEQRWAQEGAPDGQQNEAHRLVELVFVDNPKRYVFVDGDDSHTLKPVLPDHTAGPTPGNGWVYVSDPAVVNLSAGGRKVVIRGVDFPLSGAAIDGLATHSGEAYARHLALDVNAHPTVQVKAWATGHVCNLALAGDNFALELVSTEDREITLSSTEDVTVTRQFSRSTTTHTTSQNTGNRTIAVGASLDYRSSRQFEQSVTGNSAISARLVSIPAPPEFLALVKDFLKE
ncbi:OmpA family protein [Ideonella sp.]|jgi:outer membrane protein OmpA-like peptidoglycan-associated protein|uniref:OmpA family protein n=1 Tax=Ideonella sp. TaxID=1929293 RepID=UPI0037C10535